LLSVVSLAQEKFATKNGKIDFFSTTMLEDIEAKNKKAVAELNAKTGALHFIVLMKGFEFEHSLMQEHFNEDYVESDKFPLAEFKGVIVNNSSINYAQSGSYQAKVKGRLTLHGVTKDIEAAGTIQVYPGYLTALSSFYILLSDYGIKLSSLASTMISNKIKITSNARLEPM
jgi:hypothetical protein